MSQTKKDIFDRLKAGEPVPMNDPQYTRIGEAVNRTIRLSTKLNMATNTNEIRAHLSEIIGRRITSGLSLNQNRNAFFIKLIVPLKLRESLYEERYYPF